MTVHRAVVSLGSNLGDRRMLMRQAMTRLAETVGMPEKASSLYETAPWGFESEHPFLNQVAVFQTELCPEAVLAACLAIESELGRERPGAAEPSYLSRTMDIDLLFYDNLVLDTPSLILPHPRIPLRRFVLVPLHEILPDWVHPRLHQTVTELLGDTPDKGEVCRLDYGWI